MLLSLPTADSADPATRTGTWIAVNTHAHKEPLAVENLIRQGYATYCPLTLKTLRRGRTRFEVKRTLFPGYVFVDVDPEGRRWRPILSTVGVRSVVRFGERPSLVPQQLIAALRAREVDGAIMPVLDPLSCGQQVQITGGALEGLVGTILELREKDRIVVLLQLLNQQVRVRVGRAHLAAAAA